MAHRTDLTPKQVAKSFISGGIAGVVSKTIAAPLERVKYLYLVHLLLSRQEIENLLIVPSFKISLIL